MSTTNKYNISGKSASTWSRFMWRNPLLAYLIIFVVGLNCHEFELRFKLVPEEIFHNADYLETEVVAKFQLPDPNLNETAIKFCNEYSMNDQDCKEVFLTIAFDQKRVHPTTSKEVDEMILTFLGLEGRLLESPVSSETILTMENSVELSALKHIWSILSLNNRTSLPLPTQHRVQRIVFVHSCSLNYRNHDILRNLLDNIITHKLIDSMQYVFVLNYGNSIPEEFQQLYTTQYPHIHFIQVTSDVTFSEVPTLRILHKTIDFYKRSDLSDGELPQVLYLHTKGVSYIRVSQAVADWVNMMLYFLVEKHEMCYHLLASQEFDVIGVNYVQQTTAFNSHFSGNFWWATGDYIAKQPILQYNEDKLINRRNAEFWLLNETNVIYPATRWYAKNMCGLEDVVNFGHAPLGRQDVSSTVPDTSLSYITGGYFAGNRVYCAHTSSFDHFWSKHYYAHYPRYMYAVDDKL